MHFLAIDAGGSKTECAVANGAEVLGRARESSARISEISRGEAFSNLERAICDACSQAGISPRALDRSCVGLAGASVREIREWFIDSMRKLVSGEVILTTDAGIALESAFGGGPGVLVIAGTGSIALARNAAGQTARAGGWGPLVSDEGSASWIGRTAVGLALRGSDCGSRLPLLGAVLRHWSLQSVGELISLCQGAQAPGFAGLLPAVVECADSGDAQAAELLADAGARLAELVCIVTDRLWKERHEADLKLAYSGGVLKHARQVREALDSCLRRDRPWLQPGSGPVDPVMGALWIARRGDASLRSRVEFLPAPEGG